MVQFSVPPRVINEHKVIMLLHGIHVKIDFKACVICHIATKQTKKERKHTEYIHCLPTVPLQMTTISTVQQISNTKYYSELKIWNINMTPCIYKNAHWVETLKIYPNIVYGNWSLISIYGLIGKHWKEQAKNTSQLMDWTNSIYCWMIHATCLIASKNPFEEKFPLSSSPSPTFTANKLNSSTYNCCSVFASFCKINFNCTVE